MPRSSAYKGKHLIELLFYPEGGGNRHLPTFDTYLPNFMASLSRRQ